MPSDLRELTQQTQHYIASLEVCHNCNLLTTSWHRVCVAGTIVLPQPLCVACIAVLQDREPSLEAVELQGGRWQVVNPKRKIEVRDMTL